MPDMELKALIGKNIKYLSRINKVSNNQLASMLGKTHSTVSNYKQGQTLPPADILLQLSKIFQITIDDLMTKDLENYKRDKGFEKKEYSEIIEDLVEQVADLAKKYETLKK